MSLGRGLDFVIQDLDSRQRQGPASKNRPIQKFASALDTIYAKPDAVTIKTVTPAYHWATQAGSTDLDLQWGLSEWT